VNVFAQISVGKLQLSENKHGVLGGDKIKTRKCKKYNKNGQKR